MKQLLTNDEWKRMTDNLDKVKYRCNCGHRIIIPKAMDKKVCDWCGNYVFKNKKDEFKYRVKEKIK